MFYSSKCTDLASLIKTLPNYLDKTVGGFVSELHGYEPDTMSSVDSQIDSLSFTYFDNEIDKKPFIIRMWLNHVWSINDILWPLTNYEMILENKIH